MGPLRTAIASCLLIAPAAPLTDRPAHETRPAARATLPTAAATSTANTASLAAPLNTIEIIVRRNDTLDAIFRKLELDLHDLALSLIHI